MKVVQGFECIQSAHRNDFKRFPDRTDARFADGLILPTIHPKFILGPSMKVFTIGSCFARSIEPWLLAFGLLVPTRDFGVPKSEWPSRPNGILNEFNPGSMAERILAATSGRAASVETIVPKGDGFIDLLLPGGTPVSRERALARRAEIDAVYRDLASSDLVVLTLGLVEAWHDDSADAYLNQMPDPALLRSMPGRYSFRRLDVEDSMALLEPALSSLRAAGVTRILVTVSPVPLQTTFAGVDAVVANSFSKSVLRVCADRLSCDSADVDYFASYEIALSAGIGAFMDDLVHVKEEIVGRIVDHMLSHYFPRRPPADWDRAMAIIESAANRQLPAPDLRATQL